MITTIIATIFVIGLLVFFHELGHFITAKLVGMRVHEFALGFGPKLISKQKGETLYSIRVIPLGGFNKIAGMDPEEEQDEYSFNSKPIWARMLVIVAGPLMNFLLPILLFLIVFLGAGIDTASENPVIGQILPDQPAARVGLVAGDRIVSVNGVIIDTWPQFVNEIRTNPGKEILITYERDNQRASVKVVPDYDPKGNRGIIGVVPQILKYRPGPSEALSLATKSAYANSLAMLSGIGQMITGRAPADVAGPIGVAQMAGEVAKMGILPLLYFSAILSINLGLINLLPVPVLDGGHIVTLAVEAVRGRPLSPQKTQAIQMIGFTLLMMLMLLATYKDLIRNKWF